MNGDTNEQFIPPLGYTYLICFEPMVNLVKALSAPLTGRNVGFETQIIENTIGCFLDNFYVNKQVVIFRC